MTLRQCLILGSAVLLSTFSCGRSDPGSDRPRETTTSIRPGEEPLETETIGAEDVQTLPTETPSGPAPGNPCGWARAWRDPSVPNPMLAGVGGVAMPQKTVDAPVSLPVREPSPPGEIVAEIVIAPDGSVVEASIVSAPEPRWPEAEDALLGAVRKWRYEPMELDDTPISVCSTVVMGL